MAGWDRFLTAADRELLARTAWAKKAPFGFGERPAVVVVDAYYGALGERGVEDLARWPGACGPAGWAAVDRTVPVLGAARAAGAPVFFLTGLAANPNPWNRKARRPRDPDHLRIVDELAPGPGEVVLEKASPSGFTSSPLDALLTAAGVDTVLVCGEATSGCVRATAVDACVLGYRVGVLEDCCFDRVEASHWVNLFDLDQKYADVVDGAAAVAYLAGSVPGSVTASVPVR
jgi:maleamate amidohydrolase